MMASSNYSSSSPSRIIIDYSNQQQQQSASTSSISTITTSAPLTSNIILNQSSVPKIQTQIYRVPSHFVYSNQNYGNEITVNNVITEVKNPLENRYRDGVDERSNSGELQKNHVRILMYQPPIIDPPVSLSNSLSDVKLIVNEGSYGDVSTQILLQNHQPVLSTSVASTSHYSVISPYTIHQSNSNDVNNGSVEYVVLQHDNNDDNNGINTNSNEIQSQSQFSSTSIFSLDSMQLQEDRGIGNQDNIRRVRNLEAKRRRLENETEDDRAKRRARDAETKRVRRQRETSEQRARRLMRDSQRMRRTRRIKRLLGPTATLSDLKRTGLTLEDLDSYNSGNRNHRRSPNNSQYSSSHTAHGVQVTQSSGVAISYENLPQSHTSQMRYSNTTANTNSPISSTTVPVATIGTDTSVVNGNSTCNGFVTLHVTLPPGSDSQKPQILHLPASHTLPQHIIVQRTSPPIGQQTISTPIHQVISTTSQPNHRQLLQQTSSRQILQQRVLTTTCGPQLATIATPIIQEQRILNGHHIQQIHSQSNLNSIGISATHLINSQQLHNTHSPHSIVYRTAPPEEYDVENYKDFIVQQPFISQQHQLIQQHHSHVNSNINNSTNSSYTTEEIIKKKNKLYKAPKPKPVFKTQQKSISNENTVTRINNAPISERFKGLTEDQILRRRRANAERSRRRRQLETPEQREERNKRTAERMRIRRAQLAQKRLIDSSSGNDIIPLQPVTKQLTTLSLDRFEEIFQSVLLRCRNSSNEENIENTNDNQKLCIIQDNNIHDNQKYISSQQQSISYGNIIDSTDEAILHTQMCATPSYIIVNNEQDENQNETEDQKPLNFLNIRETEKLEEQEDLSYQHDTFKNDDVSLSKLATESKVNEKINFDFTITNAALDPFSNKNNNLTDDSKINVEKDII